MNNVDLYRLQREAQEKAIKQMLINSMCRLFGFSIAKSSEQVQKNYLWLNRHLLSQEDQLKLFPVFEEKPSDNTEVKLEIKKRA